MIEVDKVVEALDVCTDTDLDCTKCPYYASKRCRTELMLDVKAIAEGYAQKQVKPLTYFHGMNEPFTYRCGHCHHTIEGGQHYCAGCGWRVRWG